MNLFSISKKQISGNLFIYIISVILVTISIIIFNSTYSSIQTLFSELKFAYGFDDPELYVSEPNSDYYDSLDRTLTEEESTEYIEKILDGYCKEMKLNIEKGSDEYYALINNYDCMRRWTLQHHEELGDDFTFEFIDNFIGILKQSDAECTPLFTYSLIIDPITFKECKCYGINIIDPGIASRLRLNILKGQDLNDVNNSGNYIEAIAVGSESFAKKVKIGDTFETSFYNFETNEYEKYNVKIIGLLGSPFYLLGGYTSFVSENSVSLDKLISRNSYSKEHNGGSFQLISLPFETFDSKEYFAGPNPTYYFTLKNSTEENTNKIKHLLVSNGYDTVSVKNAYQNTYNEIIKELQSDIVVILLAFALSLLTICGTITLNILNNHKMHYIMMICGAKLRHHVIICTFNILIMCFISTFLSVIYFTVSNYKLEKEYGEFFGIIFDINNIIITLTIVVVSIIVCVLISRKIYLDTLYSKHLNK